jgi:hypothetical protein
MKKEIVSLSVQLCKVIQCPSVLLPVYVRFRSVDNDQMLAVQSCKIAADVLQVLNADNNTVHIEMETLVDIAAFRDASGKAIFLHDFEGESKIHADNDDSSCEDVMEVFEELRGSDY